MMNPLFVSLFGQINAWDIILLYLLFLLPFFVRYWYQVRKAEPSKGSLAFLFYGFIIIFWLMVLFMHLGGVI